MWQRTRDEGASFDSEGIRAVAEEVVGGSLEEFFDRYVFGTEEIPFEDFFGRAGYRLTVDEQATRRRDRVGYLGVRTREVDGRVRIEGVVLGSSAWRDGLNYGDEILEIGGSKVTSYQSFAIALRSFGPGAQVEFLVSRFGRERSIPVTLGARSVPVYRLE
ncbi:MAG: PDZ domain-containing protein, partial [Acidobacteria bacterium]|nr:PDZ domain-containing protein [Acidobacteriota bacterium]